MEWRDPGISIGYLGGKESVDFIYDSFSSLGPIQEKPRKFLHFGHLSYL